LLLAERDGEVLGYIHMALKEIENSMVLRPRRYIKIHDLAVGQIHHRRGAGSALMQAAERWAKEKGVDTIELNVWEFNSGAFAFYQELGYITSMRHMWKRI
jgi:GNAT superfamily N-acetyltransferase